MCHKAPVAWVSLFKDNPGLPWAFPKCWSTLIPESLLALVQQRFLNLDLVKQQTEKEQQNTASYAKLNEAQKEEEAKVYNSHWL